MSKEYLDENGLSRFFSKIKAFFVKKSGDTMSGSLAVGDKRTIWDANPGTYISPYGFISARGSSSTTPGLYVTAHDSTTPTYDAGFYYDAANSRWYSNRRIYSPGLGAISGMAASGPSTAISVQTGTATDLLTTAISLAAYHRYLLTYVVQWGQSATGLRATSVTIGGSSIGIISQDQRQAVSGGVTYNNGTVWIQPSSSARTCMIRGTQTSGGPLNATARYQLIDFGT